MKGLLDKINAKLNTQGGFLKAISVLVGGTAVAQLISILALPFLTRIYGPESFSVLAVYVSLLTMLTTIAGMCLEYAIPLPKSRIIAAALCILSMISVIFFSILSVVIVLVASDIFNILTHDKVSSYLWFIPFGVLLVGMYNSLQYWNVRHKRFGLISKTKVTQGCCGTGIKLGSGYLFGGWIPGLILGQIIMQGAGLISFSLSLIKNDWQVFRSIRLNHLKIAFNKYKKFPQFTTLEVFANTGSIQIPILLIAYFSVGKEAGYLMIAMQLLSAPMSLVNSAISQVYLAEAAQYFNQGKLRDFTVKIIVNLVKVALIPFLAIVIIAPIIIPYFLGAEWRRTGELISWLIPGFFMQFITSPISTSLYISGNQKIAFYLQIVGLVLRVGCVCFAALFANNFIVEFYAISGFIFYAIYLVVILIVLNKSVVNLNKRLLEDE